MHSAAPQSHRPLEILVLSAHTPQALTETARRLQRYLLEHPRILLPDLCAAINARTGPAPHRLALLAGSNEQLHEHLSDIVAGIRQRGQLRGCVSGAERPRIAFLFTGQGSQYPHMARQLYTTLPIFKRTLDRCAELLRPYLAQPLLSVLYPEVGQPSPLHETAYAQPALLAVQYALARAWHSWGVEPAIVIGHSVGEYGAAVLADVFSLEDGLRLLALRGRLMQALPADGGVAAIFTDEARVRRAIEPYRNTVSIAAINGPTHIVISGRQAAIDALLASFKSQEILTCSLTVSRAFHSPLMDPMLEPFERAARRVCYHRPRMPIVSNLTGAILPPGQIPDAGYWRRHIRGSVRFADGLQSLCDHGYRMFVELGPDAVLIGMGKRALPRKDLVWLASVEKGIDNWQTLLTSLATLYVHGVPIDWSALNACDPQDPLMLPADLIAPALA